MAIRALIKRLAVTMSTDVVMASCSNDSSVMAPAPGPQAVLLKDIIIDRLPSPYYHFEYDASQRISVVSFASGFTHYDVAYDGDRISELRNNIVVNHDRLVYVYDDGGRVTTIKYTDENDVVFTVLFFSYTGQQLTGLERDLRVTGGFVRDKTMSFSYDADGNLLELTEHRPAVEGLQTETTTVDRFERYDGGINVDGFDLLHDDFFDHLALLPTVQLQKGNPARVTHTGDGDNYTVDYTYRYDSRHRPVSRSGDLAFLTGQDAGRHFQVSATFSYYN
ncbi:MAG TPA: hypothetical protein VLJ83_00480 [Gemmatimonadaceae bacterium]|nr:hypothetical protein [Gemmatimonadaceae bacterium]